MNDMNILSREWTIEGTVQGSGVRPALVRVAMQCRLLGRIFNTSSGVTAILEGRPEGLDTFHQSFRSTLALQVSVDRVSCRDVKVTGFADLRITQESITEIPTQQPMATAIPRDTSICKVCQSEWKDHGNRRHEYPLLTCAECGPRFTIVRAMPFERSHTSMAAFALCDDCRREFETVTDRRFHAQTIACHKCGPRLWAARSAKEVIASGNEAMVVAIDELQRGRIVALRGIGGYQLLVDAANGDAVTRLRCKKRRDEKPLAVIVADLDFASQVAVLSAKEAETLSGASNPILLVCRRTTKLIAENVHPGLRDLGIMLPTTALHGALVAGVGRPLVCTSANLHGDSLIVEQQESHEALKGIADLFLHHDRPIVRPLDDSVMRVMAGRTVCLRHGRGVAPQRLKLPCREPILALGGHLKSAIAWCNGSQAVLGPHIGDLDSQSTRERLIVHFQDMKKLYGFEPSLWLHDQHPDYFTTIWAQTEGRRTLAVPHHEAHVAAGILEHQLWGQPMIGFAWDGAGWGGDDTVWGGEMFQVNRNGAMHRLASLRPLTLPGGDLAAREPWRVALSLLHQCMDPGELERFARQRFPDQPTAALLRWLKCDKSVLMKTTSVGRLFDGVAAICLGLTQIQYEGQAAMLWESVADASASGVYPVAFRCASQANRGRRFSAVKLEIDWRPMIRMIIKEFMQGISIGIISQRFHRSLADVVRRLSKPFIQQPIVLSGGAFQNKVLVEMLANEGRTSPFYFAGAIPPNDGGLAAGQLAWYTMRCDGTSFNLIAENQSMESLHDVSCHSR